MATRVHVFEVETPAGTPQSSPQTTALDFPEGEVDRIEVLIPPGPSGLLGWAIDHSNQRILPYESAGFIVADGEVIKWDLERFPTGRDWQAVTYNEDVYPHTIYLRFLVNDRREVDELDEVLITVPQVPVETMTGG